MQGSLLSSLLAIVTPASAQEVPHYDVVFSRKILPEEGSSEQPYTKVFLKIGETLYSIGDVNADGSADHIVRYDTNSYCSITYGDDPRWMPFDVNPATPSPKGVFIFNADPPLPANYVQGARDTSTYAQREADVLKAVYAHFLEHATIPPYQEHTDSRGGYEGRNSDRLDNVVNNSPRGRWDYWTTDPTREVNHTLFANLLLGYSAPEGQNPTLVSLSRIVTEDNALVINPILIDPRGHKEIHIMHTGSTYGVPRALFADTFPSIAAAFDLEGPFLVDARVFPDGELPQTYATQFTVTETKGYCKGYLLEKK